MLHPGDQVEPGEAELAHDLFRDRWSPRAFAPDAVDRGDVETVLDAARRAPSQRNSQPWRFFVTDSGLGRDRINAVIAESNRIWCDAAPVLVTVVARHDGSSPDRELAIFDAGSAWMSMALQAELLGMRAHAMGGFDRERALDVVELDPATHFAACVVALGRQGDPARLPDHVRERERRRDRLRLDEVVTWR